MLLAGNLSAEKDWNKISTWVYQLCNYKDNKLDEIASASGFDLAVIDLSRDGTSGYFTQEEIEAVKKTGKFVLAYFEVGAIENYRPEWDDVPNDLLAGKVGGWPNEQFVKFWDERWWPVVQGRVDQALKAGFNGAYLDLITAYEEIKGTGLKREELAHRMVSLIERLSKYAKVKNPDFKVIAQNSPELYSWNYWEPKPNKKYIDAIDGIAIESVFYLAHDKPAVKGWCKENRDNALAIKKAGKLLFGVDYCRDPKCIADAYKKQREAGFIPYVSVRELNIILREGDAPEPQKRKKKKKKSK